jgi:plastocyanin
MLIYRVLAMRCALLAIVVVLLAHDGGAQAQSKNGKDECSQPDPPALCNADNTCGSTSNPCSVDVKRTTEAASVTPSIRGAKGNSTFCLRVGTSVVWKSETKHQGFVVDMGPSTPFDTDDIIGGSDKPVTVVAKKPGCYKYSAGACLSGATYGMCGNSTAVLIVVN